MKKLVSGFIIALSLLSLLAGCSDVLANDMPNVVHQDESVKLIYSMMELDYASMAVAEFNETIQTLCEDADTTVFQVISDAYEHFAVYDDSGEFMYHLFSDHNLEAFMQTTLSYSAQEIFGEPVHLGTVTYMTMPDMTAMDVFQKREQTQPDEWERYFQEMIADISVFPVLSYAIETNIPTPETLTVSERDSRINDIQAAIRKLLLGMDKEAVSAENLWDVIEAEFEMLSVEFSDAGIAVKCRMQGLERDI